jgi:hypothetical protein
LCSFFFFFFPGQGSSVRSHLAWAVLVVEACVELCTSKYVPWRITLYQTLCASHIAAGDWESGGVVAAKAKEAVVQLREDEMMDPPIPTTVSRNWVGGLDWWFELVLGFLDWWLMVLWFSLVLWSGCWIGG